jgi:hypothetical protein
VSRIVSPARRVKLINDVLARMERNPADEIPYFEALVDLVESLDFAEFNTRELKASAMLSLVAVRSPHILDLVVRRAA